MLCLVAEIAEPVKQAHNPDMQRLKNPFSSGNLALRGQHRGAALPRAGVWIAVAALWAAGCGPRPTPAGYAADDARAFVQKHRAKLQEEVAIGSGPRIYDLAILANCQDVPELGRGLHQHQAQLFASGASGPADAEVAERVVRFMEERRELRCLNLDVSRTREFAAGRRHIGPWRGPTSARNGTP